MESVLNATDARVHFGDLLRRVTEQGETVVVERGGVPQVVVIALAEYRRMMARQAGLAWRDTMSVVRERVRQELAGAEIPQETSAMNNSPVCVDASFVARLFVGPEDGQAWKLFGGWNEAGRAIYAPTLLMYELANVFYRYHRAGHLSLVTTELVLEAALELPLQLEPHAALSAAALRLAAALDLSSTYHAFYLALAEKLNAELWTADERLRKKVGTLGPAVRLIGSAQG
jgi:prevent-host-death family protein